MKKEKKIARAWKLPKRFRVHGLNGLLFCRDIIATDQPTVFFLQLHQYGSSLLLRWAEKMQKLTFV